MLPQKFTLPSTPMHLIKHSVSFCFLLLLAAGCQKSAPPIDLSIKVEPAGRSGTYTVTGSTNLPDRTRINVQGVRYLQSASAQSSNRNANFSVLAYQTVEVAEGKWQTTLNLWQVAPDGNFQEAWQVGQSRLQTNFRPDNAVVFTATFDPTDQPEGVNKTVFQNRKELEGALVRYTPDGRQYLQAKEVAQISLPTGKTVQPVVTDADRNSGWGNRSTLTTPRTEGAAVNPPAPKEPQSNAPLSPSAALR